jgi:hypothetical protein
MPITQRIHDLTESNREILQIAESGVCLYCSETSSFAAISEWVDHDRTAICPHCEIDSLIPSPTPALLARMREEWF